MRLVYSVIFSVLTCVLLGQEIPFKIRFQDVDEGSSYRASVTFSINGSTQLNCYHLESYKILIPKGYASKTIELEIVANDYVLATNIGYSVVDALHLSIPIKQTQPEALEIILVPKIESNKDQKLNLTIEQIEKFLIAELEVWSKKKKRSIELLKTWEQRNSATNEFQLEKKQRKDRIGDAINTIASISQDSHKSNLLVEMEKIAAEEGIEEAVRFIMSKEDFIFENYSLKMKRATVVARPDLKPILYGAQVILSSGHIDSAKVILQKLISLDDDWSSPRHILFKLWTDLSDYEQIYGSISSTQAYLDSAISVISIYSDRHPKDSKVLHDLHMFYYRSAKIQETKGLFLEAEKNYLLALKSLDLIVRTPENILDVECSVATVYLSLSQVPLKDSKVEKADSLIHLSLNTSYKVNGKVSADLCSRCGLFRQYIALGNLAYDRGDAGIADSLYNLALDDISNITKSGADNLDLNLPYFRIIVRKADLCQYHISNFKESEALYLKSKDIATNALKEDTLNSIWLHNLAISWSRLGDSYLIQGYVESKAKNCFLKAIKLHETMVSRDPINLDWKFSLSMAHNKLASAYDELGHPKLAHNSRSVALKHLSELIKLNPNQSEWLESYLIQLKLEGDYYLVNSQYNIGDSLHDLALEVNMELITSDSTNVGLIDDLAVQHQNRSQRYWSEGDWKRAKYHHHKHFELRAYLVKMYPSNLSYYESLAVCYLSIGDTYFDLGYIEEADSLFTRGVEMLEEVCATEHPDPHWVKDLSIGYGRIAGFARKIGSIKGAMFFYQKADSTIREICDSVDCSYNLCSSLFTYQINIGDLYMEVGSINSASDHYYNAKETLNSWGNVRDSTSVDYHFDNFVLSRRLGDIERSNDNLGIASQLYNKALDHIKKAISMDPYDLNYPYSHAILLERLGGLEESKGHFSIAINHYLHEYEIGKTLISKEPNSPTYVSVIVNALGKKVEAKMNSGKNTKKHELLNDLFKMKDYITNIYDFNKVIPTLSRQLHVTNQLIADLQLTKHQKRKLNSLKEKADSISDKLTQCEKAEKMSKITNRYKKLESKVHIDSKILVTPVHSRMHGNLSWYFVTCGNYIQAEKHARDGLKIDSNAIWINTNLALSLLYQNKVESALIIYRQFKDEPYNKSTYKEVFINDIIEMEKFGFPCPQRNIVMSTLNK